jgi:hypothetical protein
MSKKIILGIFLFLSSVALAQVRAPLSAINTDPRGEPELVLCSQNLQNYGILPDYLSRNRGTEAREFYRKQDALATRFATQDCDVIMAQEVLGRDEETSLKALRNLAAAIRLKNNRFYEPVVGPSNDPSIRLGYLIAVDRAEVLNKTSYAKVELPKLTDEGKPRRFSRGPLELQIRVKGKENSNPKTVTLVNFHFKSKYNSQRDPSKTEWETNRMEMAEALRRIVESRHASALQTGETLLVLAGDRNSHWDAASAEILYGRLRLSNFKGTELCKLGGRGVPLCGPGAAGSQTLFSFMLSDPEAKLMPGTHKYKKVYSWLDDILAPAPTLKFARASFDSEGNYDTGVVYEPIRASDHAMSWVRFNW